MEYIKTPNLPDGKVNTVLISPACPEEIVRELETNGIVTLKSAFNSNLSDITATHPDMNILHLGENRFLCAHESADYYKSILPDAELIPASCTIQSPYPNDVQLNVAILGRYAFANKNILNERTFGELINAGFEIIHVAQGYTKCNIVPICEHALMTEDVSIYKAALKHGLDAYLVASGNIKLQNYPHGFIGGACGKLSLDVLALTGSLRALKQYNDIIDFCRNHGVYIMELSNREPLDIGSILPIA